MIKINELKGRMTVKGYTQEMLAEKLGITSKTLGAKMKKGVFGTDEAEAIIELLEIINPADIFFAK